MEQEEPPDPFSHQREYLYWLRECIASSTRRFLSPEDYELFHESLGAIQNPSLSRCPFLFSLQEELRYNRIASTLFERIRKEINGHPYLQTPKGIHDLNLRFRAVYNEYYRRKYDVHASDDH